MKSHMNSKKRILITGSTGFVGKTMVPFLYENGFTELALVVRSVKKAETLFGNLKVRCIFIDSLETDIKDFNPDIVIHLAAFFSGKSDLETARELIDSNILFTTRLLISLEHTTCEAFINTGTFTEFIHGNGEYQPNNLYSASKHAVRSIIRLYQLQQGWKWINVVVYSPYGRVNNSSPKVIDHLLNALDSSEPKPFSGGLQKLDFIHVDDMAEFYLVLLNQLPSLNDKFYEFHLGSGESHSIREIAAVIEEVFEKKPNAEWGSFPYRENESMSTTAPISKNITLLNWKNKISLHEGIKILKDEMLKNLNRGG